jgi:hypothetical protein
VRDAIAARLTVVSTRFDVIVVVWVLALATGWCWYAASRTAASGNQWDYSRTGPAWVFDTTSGN